MKYPIQYIREHIPSFDIPPYQGQRYEALVPDTLDIQERATLAVNGLTGPTDPEKDYMLYFNVDFRTDPPSMRHRGSDICQTKFEESLPLMRLLSGSGLNDHSSITWCPCSARWTTRWRWGIGTSPSLCARRSSGAGPRGIA